MSLHKNDLRVWGVLRLAYEIIIWDQLLPVAAFLITWIFPTAVPLGLVLGIIWLGGWLLATILIQTFVCPRCRNFFHENLIYGVFRWKNPFAPRCLHCQLPKWAEVDTKSP
jgi:hypothetical protein